MDRVRETDVLVVGAGPTGLTAAIELRRGGVRCRVVDQLAQPMAYAKAVGVQPRTLEVLEGMGVVQQALDESTPLRGQIVHADGVEVARLEIPALPDIPFAFVGIPQYATEQVLQQRLRQLGTEVERGVQLTGFEQDNDGVTATLQGPSGPETVRAAYLVGADGAHSIVRSTLGLSYEGGAFAEEYMLGDVEVDWSLPHDYAFRATRTLPDGSVDGLVAIPIKGHGRYRLSMLAPPELSTRALPSDGVAHGFEGSRKPRLEDIQAVLDRLAPEPTTARNLRWSSVFRISHRIVDRYGVGRVFVAGDAAHIHPPTGAQGMNTGIQDAHNLGWKLALAVQRLAAPGLLDSYDAERRPVGEEVVGRTVRSAREGFGADSDDPTYVIRREGQLLIDYADSPIIGGADVGPLPGTRAPDATGLVRSGATFSLRLFEVLRRDVHTVIGYAASDASPSALAEIGRAVEAAVAAAHDRLEAYLVAATGADTTSTLLPTLVDAQSTFAAAYDATPGTVVVVRPDGYVGYRGVAGDLDGITGYLGRTFR